MSNPGCSGCQAWLSKPSLFPTSSIISIHTAFSSLAKHFAYLLFSNLYKPSLLILIYLFIYSKLPFLLSLINIIQLYLHSSTAFPVLTQLGSPLRSSRNTKQGLNKQTCWMKKTWPQILAFRFLPKAPPCSTRTPHTKCVTQSQDSMCFPCLKCIISSFSPLLWDKLALKEKADGKAGQRKQPMAVQACKSNWIHKLCYSTASASKTLP